MLLANFNRKEHLRHRAVSLRQHGFLVLLLQVTALHQFTSAQFAITLSGSSATVALYCLLSMLLCKNRRLFVRRFSSSRQVVLNYCLAGTHRTWQAKQLYTAFAGLTSVHCPWIPMNRTACYRPSSVCVDFSPFPFPFPRLNSHSHASYPIPSHSHDWSYSHSHGNPMGSQSFPFPCTPLI